MKAMKTLDLKRKRATLEEALKLAASGSLRIVATDGKAFVLENADDFDREIAILGKSKKFQRFLKERAKEPAAVSLDEFPRPYGGRTPARQRVLRHGILR